MFQPYFSSKLADLKNFEKAPLIRGIWTPNFDYRNQFSSYTDNRDTQKPTAKKRLQEDPKRIILAKECFSKVDNKKMLFYHTLNKKQSSIKSSVKKNNWKLFLFTNVGFAKFKNQQVRILFWNSNPVIKCVLEIT